MQRQRVRTVLVGFPQPQSIIYINNLIGAATRLFSEHNDPTSNHNSRGDLRAASKELEGVDVAIALGTNIGDRLGNLHAALRRLKVAGISVTRHSCLYESAPAYVTDQPSFLNAALEARTFLSPSSLLKTLKAIESDLGRDLSRSALRYGPRPIDLDIIFYSHARYKVQEQQPAELIIPHPRFAERPFVVAPLVDLLSEGEGRGVNDRPKTSFDSSDTGATGASIEVGGGGGGGELFPKVEYDGATVCSVMEVCVEEEHRVSDGDMQTDVSRHWSSHEEMGGGLLGLWHRMGGEDVVDGVDMRRCNPLERHTSYPDECSDCEYESQHVRGEDGVRWNDEGKAESPRVLHQRAEEDGRREEGKKEEGRKEEDRKISERRRRVRVMGVLNVTPDSFSDGGRYDSVQAAVSRAVEMVRHGVDIIDVGGQSTRPHAERISEEDELQRVLPVLQAMKRHKELAGVTVSVDTFYSRVAHACVSDGGAGIVNDVSGGRLDPDMLRTVAHLGVPIVLMHMRGDPSNMQAEENLTYDDLVADVARELAVQAIKAEAAGVPAWNLVFDPGLGFSKTTSHNLEILRNLRRFRQRLGTHRRAYLHQPLLVGPSRKSFIGRITGKQAGPERDWGTAASVAACVRGGADAVRVHNVAMGRDAVDVSMSIWP